MTEVQVCLKEGAVFTRIDESAGVVLELDRKRYYLLNETATALVELLEDAGGAMSRPRVVASLLGAFDVDEAVLGPDLDACLGELERRRIVTLTPAPAAASR
ncbi:MAG: PqqD family protein [Proteobacteria bacterium]|nr:PqqD family protein [Pseudomonadota bacterium]